jgi:hypothetical protein
LRGEERRGEEKGVLARRCEVFVGTGSEDGLIGFEELCRFVAFLFAWRLLRMDTSMRESRTSRACLRRLRGSDAELGPNTHRTYERRAAGADVREEKKKRLSINC